MNYQYMPHLGLVRVVFDHDTNLNLHDHLARTFFFERKVLLDADTKQWLGVDCAPEEWELYLGGVISWFAGQGLESAAQRFAEELFDFREWCEGMKTTPFYKPQGGLQA